MRILFLAVCLTAAIFTPASATFRAAAPARVPTPVSFVPQFLGTMSLSLKQEPFFGSMLLNNFQADVQALRPMRNPEEAASYLRGRIEGIGPQRVSMAKRAETLGTQSVSAETASAILLANALARPDQFQDLITGIEQLKPGLGEKVGEMLQVLGRKFAPELTPLLYNAKGKVESFFDGR